MTAAALPAVILIIDSDPITLTGVAAVLHSAGYECHCARGEEAAHKAVQSLALDLIICDVNLNGASGVELCRELRKMPGAMEVPVMFASGVQIPDIIRRSHDAGGAYFLRKPFDPEVLIELVGKALWMPHLVQSHMAKMKETATVAAAMNPPAVPQRSPVPAPNLAAFLSGTPSATQHVK
jgi:CheY-like chemotaxis protein